MVQLSHPYKKEKIWTHTEGSQGGEDRGRNQREAATSQGWLATPAARRREEGPSPGA